MDHKQYQKKILLELMKLEEFNEYFEPLEKIGTPMHSYIHTHDTCTYTVLYTHNTHTHICAHAHTHIKIPHITNALTHTTGHTQHTYRHNHTHNTYT